MDLDRGRPRPAKARNRRVMLASNPERVGPSEHVYWRSGTVGLRWRLRRPSGLASRSTTATLERLLAREVEATEARRLAGRLRFASLPPDPCIVSRRRLRRRIRPGQEAGRRTGHLPLPADRNQRAAHRATQGGQDTPGRRTRLKCFRVSDRDPAGISGTEEKRQLRQEQPKVTREHWPQSAEGVLDQARRHHRADDGCSNSRPTGCPGQSIPGNLHWRGVKPGHPSGVRPGLTASVLPP